jgi:hypothetical protein
MTSREMNFTGRLRAVLTDDLRRSPWRGSPNPMAGHCYVASEALFHLLGGKMSGWTPQTMTVNDVVHWFLRHEDGRILDPTFDQFDHPLDYDEGRGRGFLTRQPSKRAAEAIRRFLENVGRPL